MARHQDAATHSRGTPGTGVATRSDMPPRDAEAGSALIEALVAAGFFAAAAVGVVQLATLAVGIYADAGERSRSVAWAESGLSEIALGRAGLATGGDLETDTPGFVDHPEAGVVRRWRIDEGPVAATRRVRLRVVNARVRRGRRTVDVSTIVPVGP